jgi:hypothetical protein
MPLLIARLRPLPLLLLCGAIALLASCQRTPAPLPGADAEPAAAMHAITVHLRNDDLVGYARAMVTPSQYAALETAWRDGRSRWPLTELPLSEELPKLLATLSAPNAEATLRRDFEAQIAGQGASVRQAAHSLGMFGVQYLRNQGDYSPEQRAHYVQLVTALSQWAGAAPLADRTHATRAIAELVAAARRTGLKDEASLRALGMEESLRRLGPFFATVKQVLDAYGLSLDTTLDEVRTGLVSQQGEHANVRIQYPLAGQQIDLTASLVRRERRWYLQRTQDEVQALLAPAPAPVQPPPAAVAVANAGLPPGR